MSLFARSVSHFSRWSNPVAALLLLGASSTISPGAHADPGDFQSMPGLWKITLHTVKDGHIGEGLVKWKCLYDGGDPWQTFVDVMAPDASCQRSSEHRTSTALAWNISCGAQTGHGRITLDSPQHYTGNVVLNEHDVLQVEGKRYAACTGPSD
ncbi:hypothetical protein [Dyella caseinilytica]|uniref:DUF3617 family protein n=1 Tax=Dyella caseinilytica TaxID=1849581 RepID=A0ABX7GTH4_9GAMM|nr:hypothetical protein [Dyella caseinilytica]QRN53691.1 hypothetical protein ISN74_20225 [Dyella caseinilytica]GFZ88543.1 hypothetical protein GCM10011408_04060 [Dyella caseinilytica]